MDLYNPYMVPQTIPQGSFNFPRSTNKIQFFDEISSLEKFINLTKDIKYKCQSIFPLWGMGVGGWLGGDGMGVEGWGGC